MEGILRKQNWKGIVHRYFTNFIRMFAMSDNDTSTNMSTNEDLDSLAQHVMKQHANAILRLAYSYLHNMSEAEDILQETLIKYLYHTEHFTDFQHEKAWLLTVCANLSKNKIKYNKIRETDELNETLHTQAREDLTFVWEAVKSLPPKYRDVVHLFYHEGYSTKEIAGILKRNESTVRSDLNRARKQLKEILKEEYDFDE